MVSDKGIFVMLLLLLLPLLLALALTLLLLANPTALGFPPLFSFATSAGSHSRHEPSKFATCHLYSSAIEVGGIFCALFAHVDPKVNVLAIIAGGVAGGGGGRGGGAGGATRGLRVSLRIRIVVGVATLYSLGRTSF